MKNPNARVTSASPALAASVWKGNVITIVGDSFCVASDDGEKVYRLVHRALQSGKNVEMSFEGVESLSTAFLNSALGQLLGEYSRDALQTRLKVIGLNSDDELLLDRVLANAGRYFQDPQRFTERREEILFA